MKTQFHKKIKWCSGSGELLGFAIIIPFVLMLIIAILSTTQVSNAKQKMTYASYVIARATSICADQERAIDRADAIMTEIYGSNYKGYSFSGTNLTSADADDGAIHSGEKINNQVILSMQLKSDEWRKGDILVVTIRQYLQPLMPFSGNFHSQSLAVMIENDAGFDDDSLLSD